MATIKGKVQDAASSAKAKATAGAKVVRRPPRAMQKRTLSASSTTSLITVSCMFDVCACRWRRRRRRRTRRRSGSSRRSLTSATRRETTPPRSPGGAPSIITG
ncbi:hypothetical protein BRADI_4g01005v3 [Brachypodium distachyon]|uniref:Uncharacterized protein n=1 Tax=Brachypodium distachyon TaxID=15368 RepID=A0A0Q3L058_BRADI|nr:hypothetical protein BRADI_4g01005v3 [Brachypodium distachyon]